MSDAYSKVQHRVGWTGGIIASSCDEEAPAIVVRGSFTLHLRFSGAKCSVVKPPRPG
jgi:hypothetical protein